MFFSLEFDIFGTRCLVVETISGSEKHFEEMIFLVINKIERAIVVLIHAAISLLFSF